jgi:hypothetical protein
LSSSSRRDGLTRGFAVAAALILTALAAHAAPAPPAETKRPDRASRAKTLPGPEAAAAVDESTYAVRGMINDMRALYGGDDAWSNIDGFRYYVTYTIPGPGGAPVKSWTETHHVWVHGEPRTRIDVDEDSTIVVVTGDTTHVRRDGAWTTDSLVVAAGRAQALDTWWTWQLPRNLMDPRVKARQLGVTAPGQPFVARFTYDKPGLDRPQGTVLTVTFAPPTYTMRTLHWYDPRAKAWYRLELADDRQRYGYTWAERRTLHASDEAGEVGPVVWTAVVQDFQVESQMPSVVLAPPSAGPGVVHARAVADTTRGR